mmetsp:Transcript_9063/g.25537  ORF Transcript_9063/g.25537 Transcript_9063/m.25537 type:complete len:242 (-) Transcript_9063:354-1079(-)
MKSMPSHSSLSARVSSTVSSVFIDASVSMSMPSTSGPVREPSSSEARASMLSRSLCVLASFFSASSLTMLNWRPAAAKFFRSLCASDFAEAAGGFTDAAGGFVDAAGGFAEAIGGFAEAAGGFDEAAGGFAEAVGGFTDAAGGFTDAAGGFTETAGTDLVVDVGTDSAESAEDTDDIGTDVVVDVGAGPPDLTERSAGCCCLMELKMASMRANSAFSRLRCSSFASLDSPAVPCKSSSLAL